MTSYVALLRGIGPRNPNMRNDRFRDVVQRLGFGNVRTVLGTGNVLFDSDETDIRALEDVIEPAWPDQLGFKSTTIVRSRAQLASLVKKDPFGGVEHGRSSYQLVTFVKHPPARLKVKVPYEDRERGLRVVEIHRPSGAVLTITDTTAATKTPDVMTWLEKQLGKENTSRTSLTVSRILKKMTPGD